MRIQCDFVAMPERYLFPVAFEAAPDAPDPVHLSSHDAADTPPSLTLSHTTSTLRATQSESIICT